MNKKSIKEYRIWRAMKARCYAPSQNKGYYKKDNIRVCERWEHSFQNFIDDMGPIPGDEYSIERIDINVGYFPENCKWIPQRDQSKNRRNSRLYTIGGHTACLADWARCFGINYRTLYYGIFKYGKQITDYIPNDLKAVDTAIREYYGMGA